MAANDITPAQAPEPELESRANRPSMRHPDPRSSTTLTILFLSIFILAFFPGALNHLLYLPVRLAGPLLYPAPRPARPSAAATMSWFQKTFTLPSRGRGSYLIDADVAKAVPEIAQYRVGLLHLFVQHTSCALGMNENWDGEVREDMSDALDRIVPEDRKGTLYRHSAEGPDDMPAHVKAALIGSSVTIPITEGKLSTGTWQGIWLMEFRTSKHSRRLVATIQGEKKS